MKNQDIKNFCRIILLLLLLILIAFFFKKFFLSPNTPPSKNNVMIPTKQTQQNRITNPDPVQNTQTNKIADKMLINELNSNYDFNIKYDQIGANPNTKTDFYSLVLSWSPDFCSKYRNEYQYQYQCNNFKKFTWIIHGLWAESKNAKSIKDHPRFCKGDLPKVSPDIIKKYLDISPSAKLLQSEWEKHGACIFENADDYFTKQSELYKTLKLPNEKISNKQTLLTWIKNNNLKFKYKYIKLENNELHFCYNLDWQPIDCR